MRWVNIGYALSLGAHAVAYFGMEKIDPPPPEKQQVTAVVSTQKKEKPKAKEEKPKPIEAPKETLRQPLAKRAPPPEAPPPEAPPANAPPPQVAAMPDFGIQLSGAGPAGGMAFAVGSQLGTPTERNRAPREKILGAAPAAAAATAAAEPAGELVKAKAENFVQPSYTDDARAAGIEGRVRVQVTVDTTGTVVDAKILAGLGHGLDESAVTAAKRMKFSPATRGGVPVESTFVISIRFVLGE